MIFPPSMLASAVTAALTGFALVAPHYGAMALTTNVAVPTQVAIVAIHPHNTSAFTEGLFYLDGAIIESTGLARRSFIREYRLADATELAADERGPARAPAAGVRHADSDGNSDSTSGSSDDDDDDDVAAETMTPRPPIGAVLREFKFDPEIFGEGVACIGQRIYALTYRHNKILVLDRATFALLETHPFHTESGEGWGMTTDGELLIVSDGSSSIQFYDPRKGFQRLRSITVRRHGEAITNINELEYVEGELLANVWFKNELLRIDPQDGQVLEVIDFDWITAMVPNIALMTNPHDRSEAVMNGIAYNPETRHVFLTGKLWDSIFEVELSYLARHHRRRHKTDV